MLGQWEGGGKAPLTENMTEKNENKKNIEQYNFYLWMYDEMASIVTGEKDQPPSPLRLA